MCYCYITDVLGFIMSHKKDLLSELRSLKKENQKLRRELAKYRKYSNQFADIVFESWNAVDQEETQEEVKKNKKNKYCDNCGKGQIEEVSILGIDFVVCQLCKNRKKVS